jgi:hypothetical protein
MISLRNLFECRAAFAKAQADNRATGGVLLAKSATAAFVSSLSARSDCFERSSVQPS